MVSERDNEAPQERCRIPAVVLAGRRGGEDPLARAGAAEHRALVEIDGEAMLARVLRTLRTSGRVGRIAVSIDTPQLARAVAELALLEENGHVQFIESAASPSLSAAEAVERIGAGEGPVLVTTADHALLDAEILSTFLDAAAQTAADVAVGLVQEVTILERFPETRRTWLRFGRRRYSGANLFLLRGAGGHAALRFWRRAEAHRKRPWRLVSQFGFGTLVAFALGRLDLDRAFERASAVVGAQARPILLPFAEAAIDVDTPADLALVRRIVAERGRDGAA